MAQHSSAETTRTAPNPFFGAPLLPLEDQIENVEIKLGTMIRKAETGEQWAEIARVEAAELVPLLKLQINERVRKLHARHTND